MSLNLIKIPKSRNKVLKFPQTPGVYIFWQNKTPIYIGKAINLKRRVTSYFSNSIFGKTKSMVDQSTKLSYIKVESDIEAILLEAKLIKKYKPKYNSELKDDKNPLYIQITEEMYPRVLTVRKPAVKGKYVFGPFSSTFKVKKVLKILRRIFPFSIHKVTKKPCFDSQIGLCRPCPSYIESLDNSISKKDLRYDYLDNIRLLKGILSGRFKFVKKSLKTKMLLLSKKEDFEKALKLRNKINLLDYISNPRPNIEEYLKNPNFYEDIRKKETAELEEVLNQYFKIEKIEKVECFDVSHLSGVAAAASMVTFVKGETDKSYYRHFRIREIKKSDDITSLNEVVKRRIRHFKDWGIPDLVVVDGGKPQVGIFYKNLHDFGVPVIGLAKRLETLVIYDGLNFYEIILPDSHLKNYLQRIRNEAHRFAKKYHQKLFSKELIPKFK